MYSAVHFFFLMHVFHEMLFSRLLCVCLIMHFNKDESQTHPFIASLMQTFNMA